MTLPGVTPFPPEFAARYRARDLRQFVVLSGAAELGERMCACVILRPGAMLTPAELVEFLAAQEIARHKLPERLVVLVRFPLSPVGKVSKKDLGAMLAAEGGVPGGAHQAAAQFSTMEDR